MSEGTFDRTVLGRTGLQVGRLGVSASYGVPAEAVERAFEQGVNYLYFGSRRRGQFAEAIRRLAPQRERFVLVLQSYTRVAALTRWSVERALKTLGLPYADVLLLGLWNKPVPERILDAAREVRERGLVRFLAVSSHNRSLVPGFASAKDYGVVHFRYNAAHPGAELDIFPRLPANGRAGMVAYTATSWGQLLKAGRVPKGEKVPDAADCYRFVLSRSEVDVCMTGPSNTAQMEHALEALRRGPMNDEELAWMRRVGRVVSGK